MFAGIEFGTTSLRPCLEIEARRSIENHAIDSTASSNSLSDHQRSGPVLHFHVGQRLKVEQARSLCCSCGTKLNIWWIEDATGVFQVAILDD